MLFSLFDNCCYQPDIDKMYLYATDPYEAKYQFLIDIQIPMKQNINF